MAGIVLLLPLLILSACASSRPLEAPAVRAAGVGNVPVPRLLAVNFAREFGTEGSGPGEFMHPSGIAVGPDGYVYVADTGNNRVQILDDTNKWARTIGSVGWRAGELDSPTSVAVSSVHRRLVFIGEQGNRRIQVCDVVNEKYRVLLEDSPDHPFEPTGIATGRRGELYVTDARGHRVWSVRFDGLLEWTRGGLGSGSDQFRYPQAVAIGAWGDLLVSDVGNRRLVRLDFAGNPLPAFDSDGAIRHPGPVASDEFGRWYVCDTAEKRIVIFDRDGKALLAFGDGQFLEPAGIAVANGGRVLVSDRLAHSIKEFRVVNATDGTTRASTGATPAAARTEKRPLNP